MCVGINNRDLKSLKIEDKVARLQNAEVLVLMIVNRFYVPLMFECENSLQQRYVLGYEVDPKTGQGLFFQTFHAKALGGLKEVSASIVSSSAVSCNGTVSSLGLHFQSPTPVTGWTDKLIHPPFSHEITWCRKKNTKNATFSLTQPLALTIPVSELKCAQTVKFCIKYTFINMR